MSDCDIINDINCVIVYNFCKSIYKNFLPSYNEYSNELDYSLTYIQQIDNWTQFCNTTLNDYFLKDDYFINTKDIPIESTIYQTSSDYATKVGFLFQNIVILFILSAVIKTKNKINEKFIVHFIQLFSALIICYWAYFHNNLTFLIGNAGLLIFEVIITIYIIRLRIKENETKRYLDCNDIISL